MSDNLPKLTTGVIPRLFRGEKVEDPILQILKLKTPPNEDCRRYQFVISDGQHFSPMCLMYGREDTEEKILKGELAEYSIVRLNKYTVDDSKKKIVVMLEPECLVMGLIIGQKIGTPVLYEEPEYKPNVSNPVKPFCILSPNSNLAGCNSDFQEPPRKDLVRSNKFTNHPIRANIITPISHLSLYIKKWAIRGRCTSKTPKKFWKNAKGDGSLFSFTIEDDSGEVRITAFKNECDRYFDLVEIDKVYTITNGLLKPAIKKFTQSDYEITISGDGTINIADELDTSCPQIKSNSVKIKDLKTINPEVVVDILGVIKESGQLRTIHGREQKEFKKRSFTVVDDSGAEVEVAIWCELAEGFQGQEGSIFEGRKLKVCDYGGRYLNSVYNSTVRLDPLTPEAYKLKGWYHSGGKNSQFESLTQLVSGIKGAGIKTLNNLSMDVLTACPSQSAVITAKSIATHTGKLHLYYGCPSCKKKLVDMQNGTYKCDKCKEMKNNPDCKMVVNICLSDCTGSKWVSVFQEEAEKLLGRKSSEIHHLKQTDEDRFDDLMTSLLFKESMFKIRAKLVNYREETKITAQLLDINPRNAIDYSYYLLESIISLTSSRHMNTAS